MKKIVFQCDVCGKIMGQRNSNSTNGDMMISLYEIDQYDSSIPQSRQSETERTLKTDMMSGVFGSQIKKTIDDAAKIVEQSRTFNPQKVKEITLCCSPDCTAKAVRSLLIQNNGDLKFSVNVSHTSVNEIP
jgi:hypothetical protein